MRYISSVLEVAVASLAVFLLATALCYVWPDKDYGLSGWVQAVGSILAILAAGHLATAQARRQFEDSRHLQHIDRAHSAYRSAKSIIAIAEGIFETLSGAIADFGHDRGQTMDIALRGSSVSIKMLLDMRADLDAINLHEMPSSRLVIEVAAMRSILRRTCERIARVLERSDFMNGRDFLDFFDHLDEANRNFEHRLNAVKEIAAGLRAQI